MAFFGLADAIISISPSPGGPGRTKIAPTGVALLPAGMRSRPIDGWRSCDPRRPVVVSRGCGEPAPRQVPHCRCWDIEWRADRLFVQPSWEATSSRRWPPCWRGSAGEGRSIANQTARRSLREHLPRPGETAWNLRPARIRGAHYSGNEPHVLRYSFEFEILNA